MFALRTIPMRARQAICILALGLFVLTLSAGAALAQAIDAAGAAQLKADIERALERRATNFSAQGNGAQLQRDGELTVEPKGGYYAVVLPHISVKASDGGTMDIGVIKLNAIPAGQDLWRVTMAVPTPLTGFDPTGVPRVKFSIGKQQFTGVWHAKFDTYTEMDLNYGDILIDVNDPANKFKVQVGNISGSMKMEEQSYGKYSGPYNFVAENTSFAGTNADTGKPVDGKIARIETRGHMLNADLKKAYDFQTSMESRAEGLQSNPNNPDPQMGKAIMNDVMDYMTSFADNFDSALNLQGVDINLDDPSNPGTPMRVQMDKLGFNLNMDGMDGDKLNLTLNYGVEELNVLPTPPQSMGYMPFTVMFNMATKNLPHKVLTDIMTNNVGAQMDAQSGQGAPPNPGMVLMETKSALANAGTFMSLDGTHLKAGGLEANLTGDIRASAASMMGAVINLKLVISGVDKVMAALSSPDTPPEVMQQSMGMLGMLQSMGKPEVGPNGNNVLVYNLELTEDGRALLNGGPLPIPGMGGPGMGGPGMQGGPMPLP